MGLGGLLVYFHFQKELAPVPYSSGHLEVRVTVLLPISDQLSNKIENGVQVLLKVLVVVVEAPTLDDLLQGVFPAPVVVLEDLDESFQILLTFE